jgi:hypothetical protein
MAKRPTLKERIEACLKLREMKPHVLAESMFGDDHHAAIDAQIEVLEEGLDQDRTEYRFQDDPENVQSAAMDASRWMEGEKIDDFTPPSESWKELVRV